MKFSSTNNSIDLAGKKKKTGITVHHQWFKPYLL
jgi:hypothetical protein